MKHQILLSPLVLALLAASAQAQAPVQKLAPVIVTGQAAGLRSALDKQRAAQGVVSIVHADGIGQLPDNNAAEALARLPGVSVERDQGEGRFIRVRGLGPDLNAVTINGSLVPAAEADRRAPGLDIVPSGLIRSLEVHKTLLPEQDANSLGGTVQVQTLSAFDVAGRLFSLELGGNHDSNAGKTRPRGSLVFADRFAGNTLGLALALSLDERRFASDNVETGGAWDDGKLEEFERRRYEITRERIGAAFNLDWKPGNGLHAWARGFSSRFTDDEQRQSQAVEFEDALAPGETADGEAVRSLKSRRERSRVDALNLGASRALGDWNLSAELGASRASESKPDGIGSAEFKADFSGLGYTDTRKPLLSGPAALFTGADYELDGVELEQSLARDRVRHAKFDLSTSLTDDIELKLGAKAQRRTKTNEEELIAIDAGDLEDPPYNLPGSAFAFASYALPGSLKYAFGNFGPGLSDGALRALARPLPLANFRDEEDSTINDFRLRENTDAFYVQLKGELKGAMKAQWIAGVRHERLKFEAKGFGLRDGDLETVDASIKSSHWLPALLWRQDLSADTRWRAALTSSLVRPTFGQLAPGFVVDGDEAETGNPLLKPLRSRNLDLGIEHRLGRDGTLSAYVFTKQIKDFVFQTDLAGSGAWPGFDEVQSFANGDSARVRGLELNWQQALRQLPKPFNGLIVGVNASFARSKAAIGGFDDGDFVSRRIKLPSQSDRAINLSLGWEGEALSMRLALNHKSDYLLEVGDLFDASKDQFVDRQNQIDFALRYKIGKQWQIGFEALNLGNADYYVYEQEKARNVQLERYGRAYKINLKWSGF
jgi:TonB-dependent receptor